MMKLNNLLKILILFVLILSCEDTLEVNYDNPDYSYKLRIKFEASDSQNRDLFTLLNDSIIYRISKELNDTIKPSDYRSGFSIQHELLFDEDFYDKGKFVFKFDFKDENGTEIFLLSNIRDTTITLIENHPSIWRIKLDRKKAYHELLVDSLSFFDSDFKSLNLRYIMPYTDTIKIDSLEIFSLSKLLDKTYIGDQDIYIESFFKNDSTSYTRDTLIQNVTLGLLSDTIRTNISDLIKK